MRRRTGSMICPNCRKLISVDEERCPYCKSYRPGLWGFAPALHRLFGVHADMVAFLIAACIALYGATLLLDARHIGYGGIMAFLSPSHGMLELFGMTGGRSWAAGHWWTVFTYVFLHGSLLHVAFNLMWVGQLGRLAEELFGNAWTFNLFLLSGVGGGIAANLFGPSWPVRTPTGAIVVLTAPTVGASGAIFGLLGALLAWGKRRGGSFGQGLSQQMWGYALVLFLIGFMLDNVSNAAHAGGFVVGFALGWILPLDRAQRSGRPSQLLALALGGITLYGFVRSVAYWWPRMSG